MGSPQVPMQTQIIHSVPTKSRRYDICGPVWNLPNGNRYLTVNVVKDNRIIKRVIIEDYNELPTPWGTGLGKAPQDLFESLDTIFCNY
jgi:hypothetical protein